MNELIALSMARDGESISYAVRTGGRVHQNAVRLSAGAVHAFFEQTRKNNPSIPDGAISPLLNQYVVARVQDYDFASLPPVYVDACDMLKWHGAEPLLTWDRHLELQTMYGPQGTPMTALHYATKFTAAGEPRDVIIRVGYSAYVELKERVSNPWDRLRDAVALVFEKRLESPNYCPQNGEVVELSVQEVLQYVQ